MSIVGSTKSGLSDNVGLLTITAVIRRASVEGVVIGIYYDEDCFYKAVDPITTDENGYAEVVLDEGTYYLKELEVPDSYTLSSDVTEFNVTDSEMTSVEITIDASHTSSGSGDDPDLEPDPDKNYYTTYLFENVPMGTVTITFDIPEDTTNTFTVVSDNLTHIDGYTYEGTIYENATTEISVRYERQYFDID